MASATVDSTPDRPLQLDSIPTVDLHLLSQSELYALSLCSDGAFDLRRCDDVVIPKIDRSVFNESAGSRKQTYSRLRLAPASNTIAATSIRCRTPHLRSPKPLPPDISIGNDPERAENSRIVCLLKELFAAETNGDELVPIRVEYSDSVPELSNVVNAVRKRKRGRPRKDENAVVPVPVAVEVEVEAEAGNDVINDIIIYENVEDRDREIVNKNGVVVDVAALAGLEDPYGAVLRKRTEGLETDEQLLGFLRGLNGQWGSRRKKKKIVDASEFGDALPKGWKLLLSLKKKEGRVWLFCRRYISPNGWQFASCKEVSSYMLSIFGLQDANQPNCVHNDQSIQVTYKMASGNAADLSVQDDNKKENLVCSLSSPITSISSNHEKQVTLKIGDPVEVQVGEILKCHKCTMTFDEKDDLLHHHLSSHRRKRSKIGTCITDGVIIKEGKYECQFCHKTFNERNRYNGHVGAHVKYQVKSADASPAVNVVKSVDLVSLGGVAERDCMMKASIGADSRVIPETFDANANDGLNSDSPHSKFKADSIIETYTDKLDHELNFLAHNKQDLLANRNEKTLAEESGDKQDRECMKTNGNKVGGVDEAMDVVAAKSNCETSSETNVIECVGNGINECFVGQERSFESRSPSPFQNGQTCGAGNNAIGVSTSIEEPNQEAVSGRGLLTPNCNVKTYSIENLGDRLFTNTMDGFKLDRVKFGNNESIFDFCNSHAGLDGDSVTEVKQCSSSEGCSLVPSGNEQKFSNVDNMNGVLTNIMAESKQKRGSESIILTSGDEETCGVEDNVNRVSTSSVGEPKLDGIYNFGSNECGNFSGSLKDAVTNLEERHFESCSLLPSWREQVHVIENFGNEVSTCMVGELRQQKCSEGSLLSLSGYERNCGVEKYVDKVSTRKMEEPKFDEVQTFRNSELTVPSGGSHNGLNTGVSAKEERGLEFCSLFPSGNEKRFGIEDNVAGIYNRSVGEHMQERSEIGLLGQSGIAETSDLYISNKICTMLVDGPKHDEVQNSRNHMLSLAFGNPHAGVDLDTTTVEQERYPANCSVGTSGIEQTFGVQANLNKGNNSMVEDQQGRGFVTGLHSSSCNGGFENNFNLVYAGRVWEGERVDGVGESGNKKFMIGFGSSHAQPDEDVVAGGIWRAGEENVLQSGLTDTSTPIVQSSSCFHTFDIISDKGEDALFRVHEKYDSESGFEGLRSDRTEPVEFSFLTTHNSNSLPGDSKVFSYDAEMEQGFDSPFWLGKDALMPNIAGRNQVTTECVWCRNEFHHEPVHSGTQTGAIGSMCPTCSARISEQFNVL